jgi:hypothetical protein
MSDSGIHTEPPLHAEVEAETRLALVRQRVEIAGRAQGRIPLTREKDRARRLGLALLGLGLLLLLPGFAPGMVLVLAFSGVLSIAGVCLLVLSEQ